METAFDPYHKWLGIPSDRQPPDHYTLLAVQVFEKDPDVIDSAADQRMSHLRKFQTGQYSDLSQKLLNEVANARVCLLNSAKKAEYDRKLHEEHDPQLPPRAPIFPDVPFDPREPIVALPYGTRHAKSKAKNLVVPYVVVLSVGGSLLALCVILLCWRTPKTQVIIVWPPAERQGATVTIDGKPVTVPASGPFVVVCEPGQHDFVASRNGFQDSQQFHVARGQTVTIFVKRPPPTEPPKPIARVIIDWPPAKRQGATMTVDGTPVIVPASDPFVVTCEPGQHNLVAAREGFHTDHQQFHVVGGETIRIHVELVPKPPPLESSLVLNWPSSHRQGVTVSVDGNRVDDFPETGALKLACTAGTHTVRAEWPASLLEWEIPVRTREEVEVPAPMLLELDWPVGERSEARLWIGGKTYDFPIRDPDTFAIALKSDSETGSIPMRITRRGFETYERDIQIAKDGYKLMHVELPPKPEEGKDSGKDDGSQNGALAATISAVQEDPQPDEKTLMKKLQKEFGGKTVRLSGSIKSASVTPDPNCLCGINFLLSSLKEQSGGKAEIIVRTGLKTSIARDLKSELSKVKAGDLIFFEGKLTSEVINCRTCDGTGNAPCPVNNCMRGFIPCKACKGRGSISVKKTIPRQHISADGKWTFIINETIYVRETCPNCQGRKGDSCNNCSKGLVKCEHKVDLSTWNPFDKDKKDPLSDVIASVSFSHNRRLCFLRLKDISVWVNSGAPPKKIVLKPFRDTVKPPEKTKEPPPDSFYTATKSDEGKLHVVVYHELAGYAQADIPAETVEKEVYVNDDFTKPSFIIRCKDGKITSVTFKKVEIPLQTESKP
jgi:hypothetical protein